MVRKPYIFLWRTNTEVWNGTFAVRLNSCPAEFCSLHEMDVVFTNHNRAIISFINSLYVSDSGNSFSLRYITYPGNNDFASGKLDIIFFGKTTGSRNNKETIERTHILADETVALLGGTFPDYDWAVVDDEMEFCSVWKPFDINSSHIAHIRKVDEVVNLNALSRKPSLGNDRYLNAAENPTNKNVYLVHRYLPRESSLSRLLRMMLLHKSQLLFQVSVEPVTLRKEEEEAMIKQISQCEKYVQHFTSEYNTGYEEKSQLNRARIICDILLDQLIRFQGSPFLVGVSVASPDPLPGMMMGAIGSEITELRGCRGKRQSDDILPRNIGGFKVLYPVDVHELHTAREIINDLKIIPYGVAYLPIELTRMPYLVDAAEASAAFRLPVAMREGLPGFQTRAIKYLPLPREIVDISRFPAGNDRILLGTHSYLGYHNKVYMSERDRKQHIYIVGQTGTGKSTLLKTMIIDDICSGRGVAVVDPHGDLYEELLPYIPENRMNDVILFDPVDVEHPVGFNLLECKNEEECYFIIREMRSIMERLLFDQYENQAFSYTGPVFFQHMQMNMLLSMSDMKNPGTLLEFYEIFRHKDYWKRWLPLKWKDPFLKNWTDNVLPKMNYTTRHSEGTSWGEYISTKFDDFIFDPKLRNIFGQKYSSINIREIMDSGKIFLVNLAKGKLSESNSRFLGMVLMAKIQAAAMERVSLKMEQRKQFSLYVDEFQSIATQSFLLLLSEARKFGLNLILANQFISQIKDQRIIQSIFGNVGSIVSFRVGQTDAEILEPHFLPHYDRYNFSNLPNWNAVVKTTVQGQTVTPFMIKTSLSERESNHARVTVIRNLSRQNYSKPRLEVEKEIEASLRFEECENGKN